MRLAVAGILAKKVRSGCCAAIRGCCDESWGRLFREQFLSRLGGRLTA